MCLRYCIIPVVSLLSLSAAAHAQLPQTRLFGVFPPSAESGTTISFEIGVGADLDEVGRLLFSHPGITAVQKTNGDAPVANQFLVSIDASVPPGRYEVRAGGLFGLSNAQPFLVGRRTEVAETEPNNSAEQTNPLVSGNTVVGRIDGGGDIDVFELGVLPNKRNVLVVEAASIDSQLQSVVEVIDSGDRRVAYGMRQKNEDVVLDFQPIEGETYRARLFDLSYLGGKTYTYRMTLHSDPHVDFVMPPMLVQGQPTEVKIFGRNLPGGQPTNAEPGTGIPPEVLTTTITLPALDEARAIGTPVYGMDAQPVEWSLEGSNSVWLFAVDQPAIVATETDAPQSVTLPVEIAGQFQAVGDTDAYEFTATKGQTFVFEVFAERIGSPTDPVMQIDQITKAEDGTETAKRLALAVDYGARPGSAATGEIPNDVRHQFTAPEDGTYRVVLHDRYFETRGKAGMLYRLSVRAPQPDFRLAVLAVKPSADGKAPAEVGSTVLRKGGSVEVPLLAFREDGHNDPIHIEVQNLPPGVTSAGTVIPPGLTEGELILTAAADAAETDAPIEIIGRSGEGESAIVRHAQAASVMHQGLNGLPRTTRTIRDLYVSVMKDEQPFELELGEARFDVGQNHQILIPVKLVRRGGFDGKVDFAFSGQPKDVDVPGLSLDKGADSATVRLFVKPTAPPGDYAISLRGTATVPYRHNPWRVDRAKAQQTELVASLEARKKELEAANAKLQATKTMIEQMTAQQTTQAAERQKVMTEAEAQRKLINEQLAQRTAAAKALGESATAVEATLTSAKAVAADTAQASNPESLKKLEESLKQFEAAIEKQNAQSAALREAAEKSVAAAKGIAEMMAKAETIAAEIKLIEQQIATQQEQLKSVEATITAADASVKDVEAKKAAADKAVTDAENATKPQNKNVRLVTPTVLLTIRTAPAQLAAAVPDAGKLKRAASTAVKVTVTRIEPFAGDVVLALVTPPEVTGVAAESVTIPADQTEGTITISANAEATEGKLANLVIRGAAKSGEDTITFDVPIELTVEP